MSRPEKRLVVVSNRLPVAIFKENDIWKVKDSPGGLVTALTPTMRQARGVWIGWPGCPPEAPVKELLATLSEHEYDLIPVSLTRDEMAGYYSGFANRSIWPLFHDLLGHFSFDTDNWLAYTEVNHRFADMVASSVPSNDFIWIHDYQLLLVGRFLREMGLRRRLNFFLHIPFPSPDLLRRLPVYEELLEAMLDYDHLGFQTARDRRNFIQCVKWFAPESRRSSNKRQAVIRHRGRNIVVGHYPISIDFDEFNRDAKDTRVAEASWYLHENLQSRTLVLGLDRLDYTKGIPERFLAFERALEKYEELRGNISLIQVVVPSRLNVSEYQSLKSELDLLAGRINGRFSRHGWIPIHYQFRELDRVQLLGHYQACEIALVTPLRDGMNLVAKEYCAAQIDNRGVLIISEFTGAAGQLGKGAFVVNPYDIDGTADAIYQAHIMGPEERTRRMRILRNEVRRNDVRRWVQWFLSEEDSAPAELVPVGADGTER
jgi:trehalose 6-phosphate synthase